MANEYLQRTPTSTGNRRVFTISFWTKRSTLSGSTPRYIFNTGSGTAEDTWFSVTFDSDGVSHDSFNAGTWTTGFGIIQSQTGTTAYLRDSSSWMHILISIDTTKDQASDRGFFYINGVLMKHSIATVTKNVSLAQNNSGIVHRIGTRNDSGPRQYYDGELTDIFLVDGQALTPDVFGFYKEGKGYISAGSTQATDFRPGQWVPKTPRVIKTEINRRGGFGVNGFYLPMNDSNNFGADFHCDPNSIIKLNEELPQPRVGVATTASVGLGYTNALRADPFAANLVLALPFVSGGLNSGFGDYSVAIKGSGTQKTITTSNVSIASTASYYGSANFFNGTNGNIEFSGSDFNFGTNDFTVEMWVNSTTGNGTRRNLYWGGDAGGSDVTSSLFLEINASNQLRFSVATNGSYSVLSGGSISLNQWNHIALVKRRTTVTGYLNGVAVGIDTNCTGTVNTNANPVQIGGVRLGNLFGGYIQDLRIYNGVAKYTGGFDVPKPYTPVGIATWRAVPDTTANNFATLNPLSSFGTLTNGNLTSTGSQKKSYCSMTSSSGKWYVEVYCSGSDSFSWVGITSILPSPTNELVWQGGTGANSGGFSAVTWGNGDIIGIAVDTSNSNTLFYKNGSLTYTIPFSSSGISSSNWQFAVYNQSTTFSLNFGQNPTFSGNVNAGLSTFTDGNGKGLFRYQPPSGFLALCEDNLPTPAISDPGDYFKTVLWTGDGNSGRSITGIGFTSDLVWIKKRTGGTENHNLFDSVRGVNRFLQSNTTGAESIAGIPMLTSFDNDGFTLGSNGGVNESTHTFVAWCWRAGAGTTSTNTNGSITSVVSVNQDAGFSIVSYTGTGASATVGHGLGRAPSLVITKRRDSTGNWLVQHKSAGFGYLLLNATNTYEGGDASAWNSTFPTSSVFSVSTGIVGNQIAYCWAEIEGFSKFGSYVGNGSADGPFVYCGFKPAWLMFKRTDSVANWLIFDSGRNSTNPNLAYLAPNATDIESTSGGDIDFLSNGFKIRNTAASLNASGGTYIFAAFAESPINYSNAK